MTPKISIVTPSFNQGEFIRDTIESVLAQQYPNVEHIVIDGGSTDDTVSILKSYPHLLWTSEPDNGQTDALNRGFSRATGDILTWLNSDDFYAPNILGRVVREIETSPVVMGACAITDRSGKVDYNVLNVDRSWFDVLKYWCTSSNPTQPTIFFRREVLEAIKRPDGKYLDEELWYCMDYELWMRMWRRYPAKHVPELFSYYRNYEDHKTGRGNDPLLPEMSRVFHRACNARYTVERSFSFIIPVAGMVAGLEQTLASLAEQSNPDFEIILADYSGDRNISRELRKLLGVRNGPLAPIAPKLRYIRCKGGDVGSALNEGARAACSLTLSWLSPGLEVNPRFISESLKVLANDRIGLIVPGGLMESVRHSLRSPDGTVTADRLFGADYAGPHVVVRKAALEDVGWLKHSDALPLSFKLLFARVLHKGWQIDVSGDTQVVGEMDFSRERTYLQARADFINATIVTDCVSDFEHEPFAKVRLDHGYALGFSDSLVNESLNYLSGFSKK